MTLASLFRPTPAPDAPSGGRHAAPETDDERRVAVLDATPGRHAAADVDFDESLDEETEDGEDLLDTLGFDYDED